MDDEENKIDVFSPLTIMLFIMAFFSDLSFLGLLGIAIPAVGLAIALSLKYTGALDRVTPIAEFSWPTPSTMTFLLAGIALELAA